MTQQPQISIVVPVYNAARWLRASIASALHQRDVVLEVIAVDDGSTDSSPDILQEIARTDGRLRVIRQSNQGAAAARNTAFEHARGDFIMVLDADDLIHPRKAALQLARFEREAELGVVGTAARLVSAAGRHLGLIRPPVDAEIVRERIATSMAFVHASVMVRREVLTAGFRYNEAMRNAHDYDFLRRVSQDFAGASISEPLYVYRITGDQLTATQATVGALRHLWAHRLATHPIDSPPSPPADAHDRGPLYALGLDDAAIDGEVVERLRYALNLNVASGNRAQAEHLIQEAESLRALTESKETAQQLAAIAAAWSSLSRAAKRLGVVRAQGAWSELAACTAYRARYRAHILRTSREAARWSFEEGEP